MVDKIARHRKGHDRIDPHFLQPKRAVDIVERDPGLQVDARVKNEMVDGGPGKLTGQRLDAVDVADIEMVNDDIAVERCQLIGGGGGAASRDHLPSVGAVLPAEFQSDASA
ncbi:MAG: hypothetical protein O3A84_13460 [Proteobacteria bacterium]|nr:hypothetical protein [Pseudomonadota bacterium]